MIVIPWPVETRDPSLAYLKLVYSKLIFSRGSPTKFPSVKAKEWQPPMMVAHMRSIWNKLLGSMTRANSLLVEPTAVTPLIIRSVWVSVPVLSKQQMSILPAKGILNGSVQKSYFFISCIIE